MTWGMTSTPGVKPGGIGPAFGSATEISTVPRIVMWSGFVSKSLYVPGAAFGSTVREKAAMQSAVNCGAVEEEIPAFPEMERESLDQSLSPAGQLPLLVG